MVRVFHNGVGDAEFAPVALRADAADIVCVGELRPVKAIDVLIEALALLKRSGRRVSTAIAGEGPESAPLKALRCGSKSPTGSASSAAARRARRSPWDGC